MNHAQAWLFRPIKIASPRRAPYHVVIPNAPAHAEAHNGIGTIQSIAKRKGKLRHGGQL
jgi:hypothetical protein